MSFGGVESPSDPSRKLRSEGAPAQIEANEAQSEGACQGGPAQGASLRRPA